LILPACDVVVQIFRGNCFPSRLPAWRRFSPFHLHRAMGSGTDGGAGSSTLGQNPDFLSYREMKLHITIYRQLGGRPGSLKGPSGKRNRGEARCSAYVAGTFDTRTCPFCRGGAPRGRASCRIAFFRWLRDPAPFRRRSEFQFLAQGDTQIARSAPASRQPTANDF
jgi:hypothetical protein